MMKISEALLSLSRAVEHHIVDVFVVVCVSVSVMVWVGNVRRSLRIRRNQRLRRGVKFK